MVFVFEFQGTEETRCIRMEVTPDIDLTGLLNMKNLRCLIVNYATVGSSYSDYVRDNHKVCKYLPNAIRYLCWRRYPHRRLPKISGANNLVTLEISDSKIEQLWEGGMDMRKLKYLVLHNTYCLRTCDLGLFPNLESLYLLGCRKLVELRAPTGCLKRLVYLSICRCKRLRSLSFIKHLEPLQFLKLTGRNHKEFPDIIPADSNSSLRGLHIYGSEIAELPSSIENLFKLVYLNLEHCGNLKSLPRSFCSLQRFKVIRLDYCDIEELPGDLGKLEHLEELSLKRCTLVKHLPDSICKLKNLKTLTLHSSNFLEKLPDDLGQLESLEVLDLAKCRGLRDIPRSICIMKHLKSIILEGCQALEKLPEDVGQLESLEKLDLSYCKCLRDLPSSICKLKHLTSIILQGCVGLEKLPDDLGKLESLEVLNLTDCNKIRDIPGSICKLKHLKTLNLQWCEKIDNLPEELGDLECLKELNIDYTSISQLPRNISLLGHLQRKRERLTESSFVSAAGMKPIGGPARKLEIKGLVMAGQNERRFIIIIFLSMRFCMIFLCMFICVLIYALIYQYSLYIF
uniref:disease resistance protein RPV1-like n=1 Tax=Erigeron canadensis TaxID=72917 RepID=UPI001CB95E05|nr:disease resistance protein RPV1-like [Erigeron canadensis]